MERILFDTDIGSDIDDAVCLAYLLAQPQCRLLGITTVSGESEKRAMIADTICRAAGREVPIYPGIEQPLLVEPRQPKATQAALAGWAPQTRFEKGRAVEFLRDTIRRHPGEITLLATGPMTNVATLFALDREIPSLLKQLVLMCGVFEPARPDAAEWNALCDPHAAAIVYRSPVARHRSVGLDVTMKVTMSREEVKRRFTTDTLRVVADFAEDWFARSDRLVFHDPLAAVTIFDPDVCRFAAGTVEVETADPRCMGATRWSANPQGAHQVALEVDAARFFRDYFGTVCG